MFKFKSIAKLHNSTDITKYKYKIIFYSFGGIYAELIRNRSFEDGPRYGAPADMQGWSTHSATPSQLTAKLLQPSKKTPLLNSVQHYVVRLAANDGMEENTLDTPTAIHPVEQLLSPENGSIPLDVPSYSLNIVRIK